MFSVFNGSKDAVSAVDSSVSSNPPSRGGYGVQDRLVPYYRENADRLSSQSLGSEATSSSGSESGDPSSSDVFNDAPSSTVNLKQNLIVFIWPSEDAYEISFNDGNKFLNRFLIDEDVAFELSGVQGKENLR